MYNLLWFTNVYIIHTLPLGQDHRRVLLEEAFHSAFGYLALCLCDLACALFRTAQH